MLTVRDPGPIRAVRIHEDLRVDVGEIVRALATPLAAAPEEYAAVVSDRVPLDTVPDRHVGSTPSPGKVVVRFS